MPKKSEFKSDKLTPLSTPLQQRQLKKSEAIEEEIDNCPIEQMKQVLSKFQYKKGA